MKANLLIVDDIAQNIQLAARHLNDEGYKLFFATSGEKALFLIQKNKIDLVLLDVMMPHMDGYESCRKIKETHPDIPVICLTAKNDKSDVVKGFDAGGTDYITKPFSGRELKARVKLHLDLKSQKDKLRDTQEQLRELIHILSHDLRNSFSGISMTIDLADVQGKPLSAFKSKLQDLSRNGLDILDLVRTMFVLDEKPMSLEAVDLKSCLEHCLALLNPKINEKSIIIQKDFHSVSAVTAEETSLINSVIMNLLTNAVKFSHPEGTISVGIKDMDGRAELSIEDHGTGISREMLPNLFDVAKSKSRKGTQGEKGSGFGLPLVAKFIKAYGAKIAIDSEKGHGTKVSIQFSYFE